MENTKSSSPKEGTSRLKNGSIPVPFWVILVLLITIMSGFVGWPLGSSGSSECLTGGQLQQRLDALEVKVREGSLDEASIHRMIETFEPCDSAVFWRNALSVEAKILRSNALFLSGQTSEANAVLGSALKISASSGYEDGFFSSLLSTIGVVAGVGQFSIADSLAANALFHFQRTNNQMKLAAVHNALGTLLEQRQLTVSALEHYKQGLYLARACNDSVMMATTSSNAAWVFYKRADFKKAMMYSQYSERINLSIGSVKGLSIDRLLKVIWRYVREGKVLG